MGVEMTSIWEAMKGSQYQRTIEQLEVQMAQATNIDEGLSVALNRVVMAVHAVAGTCWHYDRFGDGRIRPKAVYGGADLGDFSLAPGEGIAGQVIQEGRSLIIPDCQKDPRWAGKADKKTGFSTKTMMCVPLLFREQTFGCIQIINKTDDLPFDEKDLFFVEKLAGHTAGLFQKNHFLDDYAAGGMGPGEAGQLSGGERFVELFSAETFAEVEEELLRTARIAELSGTQRKNILRLSREIWMTLKNNPAQPEKKKGFWAR